MIRFALIVASTLGFFLTAALGNLMTPLLRAFHDRQQPQKEAEPPTMGGLCLMTGTMAAVGVGWTAACVAQPELLGSENLLTTRRWGCAVRCGWGWKRPPARWCWPCWG